MSFLNLIEAEDPRWLCFVGTGGDSVNDRLKWNLGQSKFRRAGYECAGKNAEISPARNLKHRFERQGASAAEESNQTYPNGEVVEPVSHSGSSRRTGCRSSGSSREFSKTSTMWMELTIFSIPRTSFTISARRLLALRGIKANRSNDEWRISRRGC